MNRKTQNLISVKKRNAIVVPFKSSGEDNQSVVLTLQVNVMSLGYIFSEKLLQTLSGLTESEIKGISTTLLPVLKNIRGADVVYTPMYPNFPKQVMDACYCELFLNAITHYWSMGTWKPDYDELPREFAFENVKFVTLDVISEDEFKTIFSDLVSSNDSISEEDNEFITWFMQNYNDLEVTHEISYKEIMCVVAAYILENGGDISSFVKTSTDVLRVATYLSGGDISLSSRTTYKSFPRSIRRKLVNVLDGVIREEDLNRHRGKWIRLAHSLHVGDYSKRVYTMIQKVRENEKIETFNGKVEELIAEGNVPNAVKLLATRPGDFARRLDKLLRMNSTNQNIVINSFLGQADKVPTRILLQLMGHFSRRVDNLEHRVVLPKGSVQQAMLVDGLTPLNSKVVNKLISGIRSILVDRFSTLDSLGNVYIDPYLAKAPIPTQQRSASSGMFSVARGTRMPISGDKNTLRFFIYWKGQDIDLSATMHDENFKNIGHVSYTHLKSDKYQSYHSGDITRAPNGASEFIDITIDGALKAGVRYIAMNVFVFSGPDFSEHEVCYAGWMTRTHPNSNEIYDPKTVEQKVDLTMDSRNSIPVVFDLETREAIWFDMVPTRSQRWTNAVETTRASIEQVVESLVINNNKVSLYELFSMHAKARGKVINNVEDADTVFSMTNGITPFDVNEIQSNYMG